MLNKLCLRIGRVLDVLLLSLGVFIFLTTIMGVLRLGNAIPVGDQWDMLPFFERILGHSISITDLYSQHNEHRIFFPKLIFALDLLIVGANNQINFGFIIFFQLLLFSCFVFIWIKLNRNIFTIFGMMGVWLVILFSFDQWENFLWGFQVQFVSVTSAALLALSFYSEASERKRSKKLYYGFDVASYVMALLSVFSMANGILVVLLLVVLSVVQRHSIYDFFVSLIAFSLISWLYFHDFVPVAGHTPYAMLFKEPLSFFEYFLAYLGNITIFLGHEIGLNSVFPLFCGALGILLTVAAAIHALWQKPHCYWRSCLVAMLLFCIGTAFLTALGRFGLGIGTAYSNRYMTPTSIFWSVLLCYWLSWLINSVGQKQQLVALIAAALITFPLVLTSWLGNEKGWLDGRARASILVAGSNALLSGITTPEVYQALYPDPAKVINERPFLSKAQLAIFSDPLNRLAGKDLNSVFSLSSTSACSGYIDAFRVLSDDPSNGEIELNGWAWDAEHKKPVKRIFLADKSGTVLGYASGGLPRSDISAIRPDVTQNDVGWIGFAKAKTGQEISAYAELANGKLCQISSGAVSGIVPGKIMTNVDPDNVRAAESCDGVVDEINSAPVSPTEIPLSPHFHISGWLARSIRDGVAAEQTLLVLTAQDGQRVYIGTKNVRRPDVVAFFKKPGLISSGFEAEADISQLSGTFKLGLAYQDGSDIKICPQFAIPVSR